MGSSNIDYCQQCHRLVGFHIHNGAMCCDRCGHPAPPPMDRREAIETVKRVHAQSEMLAAASAAH